MGRLNKTLAQNAHNQRNLEAGEATNTPVNTSANVKPLYEKRLIPVKSRQAAHDARVAKARMLARDGESKEARDLQVNRNTVDSATVKAIKQIDAVFGVKDAARKSVKPEYGNKGAPIICAKSGRTVAHVTEECNDLIGAMMESESEDVSATMGMFTTTYAPHMVNTSPSKLVRLNVVDPIGLYVYLTCQIVGDNRTSFDKAQSKAVTQANKITYLHERKRAFDALSADYAENDELALQVITCNDLMMKILGISAFKDFNRLTKAPKPVFFSPSNAAKDVNSFGIWLKLFYAATIEQFGAKNNINDSHIENYALRNGGNTAFRRAAASSPNGEKRKMLERLGFAGVLLSDAIEVITSEELGLDNQSNVFDIDKINDPAFRKEIARRVEYRTDPVNRDRLVRAKNTKTKNSAEIALIADIFDNLTL